ncbi:hypothetical protein Patl_2242 [Paraglaciecola sp. T6c]|uniref:DUF7281 domain-containing protein n=1 Tax=Pseudoalteromonas atlantica (strain T6c / ATCC BAA-1087) TaxID=3042615 RepID=UPI00005C53B9|nr:hypothetical protein [Paraglaciecola sp. T6c]ABG40760.1 hypothetical protein Patl_2242 [Paraglaciecola sp. T6c]
MTDSLMPKAKLLLKEQYFALLHDEQTRTSKTATVSHIMAWCEQEFIQPGQWLNKQKHFRFTRHGIEAIRDNYLLSVGEDIFADFSEDIHQSAALKSTDEKQGRIKPTQSLVLCALSHQAPLLSNDMQTLNAFNQQFYPCEQVNVELDLARLNLADFDNLLVIENRDSFNDWHRFQGQVTQKLTKLLVIYRGDSEHSSSTKALLEHWQHARPRCPRIYFGDFDLAGMRIAVSGQYSHLLLPEVDWLTSHLVKQHYPDVQLKFLANLSLHCPQQWQHLLSVMQQQRAGLRQQMMYQTALVLYPC